MFQHAFSFDGRIRRTEFGLTLLFQTVVGVILNFILISTRGEASFLLILYIPLIWFILAQGAKRCHDLGTSGWMQLIPFYNPFIMLFQDGQPGSNQYGDNPKGILVTGGQTHQGGYSNRTQSKTSSFVNSNEGYQGGYSGGHNQASSYSQAKGSNSEGRYNGENYNQEVKYSQKEKTSTNGEYKQGDLYN